MYLSCIKTACNFCGVGARKMKPKLRSPASGRRAGMSAASTSDDLALSKEALRPPGVANRLSPARRSGCAAGSEKSGSAPRNMILFGSAGPFALAVEVKSMVACR